MDVCVVTLDSPFEHVLPWTSRKGAWIRALVLLFASFPFELVPVSSASTVAAKRPPVVVVATATMLFTMTLLLLTPVLWWSSSFDDSDHFQARGALTAHWNCRRWSPKVKLSLVELIVVESRLT